MGNVRARRSLLSRHLAFALSSIFLQLFDARIDREGPRKLFLYDADGHGGGHELVERNLPDRFGRCVGGTVPGRTFRAGGGRIAVRVKLKRNKQTIKKVNVSLESWFEAEVTHYFSAFHR